MTQTVTVEGVGDLEFPDGMSQDQMAAAIKTNFPEIHKSTMLPVNEQINFSNVAGAPLEAAANFLSGGVAVPVSGLAGIAAAGGKALGLTEADPTEVIGKVQSALTIPPHTKVGKVLTDTLNYPIAKAEQGADYVGGKVAEITGSPAAGAATKATLLGAPALLGLKKSTPANALEVKKTSTAEAIQKAKDKSSESGINWAALPGNIRKQITDFARDATNFESITPDMLKRHIETQSLPVPVSATKGQLTRDPLQLREEQQLAQTREGTPIRERYIEQNKALLDNIDIMKGKTGARAPSTIEAGRMVDKALMDKINKSKQNYEGLYKKAANSPEGNAPVSVKPLTDYLNDTLNPQMTTFAETALKKMGALTKDDNGVLMPAKDIPLKQMEELRKLASAESKDGGTKGHYAGEVVSKIDEIMDKNGGQLYKDARSAFKQHQMEFKETGAISGLVDKKSRVDRKVALEDVFDKSVLKGSIQDLKNVRDNLINDKDATIRKKGRQAYRELSGQAIEYIKQNSAEKFVGSDELGNKTVSASGLKKSLDNIGDEKLDLLFGKQGREKLRQIQQVTEDLKTSPPKRIQGSDTAINLMAMLNRTLDSIDKIPLIGNVAKGGIAMVRRANELGQAERKVGQSLMTTRPESGGLTLGQALGNLQKNRNMKLIESSALANQSNQSTK